MYVLRSHRPRSAPLTTASLCLLMGCGGAAEDLTPLDTGEVKAAVRTVSVSTANQLRTALADAQPGDRIVLADGTYQGVFKALNNGTASQPIVLEGSANAILKGNGVASGYNLNLLGDYWVLRGFTATTAQKGIVLDGANHNLLEGLTVKNIGMEAIHFRAFSSYNTVQNSAITDTGVSNASYGEGVYIGSAHSNWGSISGGQPDKSDYNRVLNNKIGPNVRAEHVDIKEGTTGGEVSGNTFDGTGLSGENAADSWVDAKGNNYRITHNRGTYSLLDGFQTHIAVAGWGNGNIFSGNTADVRASGYGFRIQLSGSAGTSTGNVVHQNNTVLNASLGAANIALTP